jgi:SHS family lactate transporter-like MFS transporter
MPWWKEPTKDQWTAWWAAWLGWTLDSFDFTIFLLIMLPISQEFGVPLTAVTAVFAVTLWLRLLGATASGWLADRVGRKTPLMISILWYSICNFIAGFSPNFAFLFFFRALLGIGMGAEWPAGASLAMESWPARSRGLMSSILQGSWAIGFLASSAIYGLLYDYIGWRGLLWIGVLPALVVVWVRKYVKEPEIWLENRKKQRETRREVRLPLVAIFKRGLLANTLTACWWMAAPGRRSSAVPTTRSTSTFSPRSRRAPGCRHSSTPALMFTRSRSSIAPRNAARRCKTAGSILL